MPDITVAGLTVAWGMCGSRTNYCQSEPRQPKQKMLTLMIFTSWNPVGPSMSMSAAA